MAGSARFEALDSWRGIAACGVAAFHFGVTSHFYDFPLFRNSSPYVDFFFVLSGFVIAHTYANRIRNVSDVGLFAVRRFGRLWPLHVFTLLCMVALESVKLLVLSKTGMSAGEAPFTGNSSALAIPAHLVFLQAVGLFHGYTWNGPSWSIGAEFWTYLVFACACLAGVTRLRVVSVLLMMLGLSVLVIANGGKLGATYDLGLFRCILGFFAGVLTYDLYSRRSWRIPLPTLAEFSVTVLAVVCIGTIATLFTINSFFSFLPILFFPLLIFVFAQQRGSLSKALLNTTAQSLGRWSYSIYMVHFVVLTVINSGLRVLDRVLETQIEIERAAIDEPVFAVPLWVGDLLFVAYFTVVIALAALTWRYIEEPFRIYFNDLARRREAISGRVVTTGTSA